MRNTDTSKLLSADEFEQQLEHVKARDHQVIAEQRRLNKQRLMDGLVSRSAIPLRYAKARLNTHEPHKDDVYSKVADYFKRLMHCSSNDNVLGGLVLVGDIGVGKTHLVCALANALMNVNRSVLYCTALEAVMLVKRSWAKQGDSEYDVYESFSKPDLLIIDEIGVQHGSDFELMALTTIIDSRSRNCLPVVAVSNYSPREVMGILGQRAFDRLIGDGGQVIEMRGNSMRHA